MENMCEPFVPPPPRPGCDCGVCKPAGMQSNESPAYLRRPLSPFQCYKLVKIEADGSKRPLSASELKDFERTNPESCEWNHAMKSGERKWQKWALDVLKKLEKQPKHYWPFKEPVDYVAFNIPDYPLIVKHPMDLRTVGERLAEGIIETPDEFVGMVRTVFRNAFLYNKPGSAAGVFECAEKLSKIFEKEVSKV